MRQYILKRLFLLVPVLIGISILVFGMLRLVPGDATIAVIGDQTNKESIEAMRHRLGFDKPVHVQYLDWVGALVLQGSLGESLINQRPVMPNILSRLPVTAELAILSLTVSILIALPLGMISAVRQDTRIDHVFRFVNVLGLSVPGFWIGTLLIVLPALWFRWAPPLRYVSFFEDPLTNLQQFMFPALAMGYAMSASVGRMTRSCMLEVLRQDYIRTAWAKGLIERVVVMRHAFKNAFIPVLTIIGLQVGYLLAGAVVMEQIFSLPGVGRLMVESIYYRDYPVVQGTVVFTAVVYVLVNLIVDLLYAWLDPRIHYN